MIQVCTVIYSPQRFSMAKQYQISIYDVQKDKQLRDQATKITEYRKALSVVLAADHGLDADRTAQLLGTSRRTVFRDRGHIRNQGNTPKNLCGGRRHCSHQARFGCSVRHEILNPQC